MAAFYEAQLTVLVAICLVLFCFERYLLRPVTLSGQQSENNAPSSVVSRLSRQYLCVYAIVMGADWLQGPYIYSLYREQYGLSERLVALLFVLGFLTAGIVAPVVGVWADQYGRKRMCLVFCLAYTLACILIQFPSLPILLCGRFLGGFSTAILFSSFESWLITSANQLTLTSRDLSTILGRATLVNSISATIAGVASNKLVERTHSFGTPFVASGILLLIGWVVIALTWSENYGAGPSTASVVLDYKRLSEAWNIVYTDKRLLALGLTQAIVEGSMYLFVFIWVPFLQETASPTGHASLPLGFIFSAYMVSMTVGSIIYTSIISFSRLEAPPSSRDTPSSDGGQASSDTSTHERAILLHAKLSIGVCVASASAFLLSIIYAREHTRFWAFCTYEACLGVYYPVQGMLRGRLIEDEHRATLSSLFRVPLNVFVVVSLMTGVSSARRFVLSTCASLLMCSALVTASVFLGRRRRGPALASLRST